MTVDPGHEKSAWVIFDGRRVLTQGIELNHELLDRLSDREHVAAWLGPVTLNAIVIEDIESYGMAVGRETFGTVFFSGRVFDRALRICSVERMTRKTVKLNLCHSVRATDSNIRVALIDRFGGTERAIGKKATPGPLYGIKSHLWAALAIAVTWWDQQLECQRRPA